MIPTSAYMACLERSLVGDAIKAASQFRCLLNALTDLLAEIGNFGHGVLFAVDTLDLGFVVSWDIVGINGGGENVFLLVDVSEKNPLRVVSLCTRYCSGFALLTKRRVVAKPAIAGPPKSQTKSGSATALEHARLTAYERAVLKQLMAETRPFIFLGAREYAIP